MYFSTSSACFNIKSYEQKLEKKVRSFETEKERRKSKWQWQIPQIDCAFK